MSDERQRQDRRDRFNRDLTEHLADPAKFDCNNGHPFPWTCSMVIYDGPGAQFFDAVGRPVLTDLIRDPEDAAQLMFNIQEAADTIARLTRERDEAVGALREIASDLHDGFLVCEHCGSQTDTRDMDAEYTARAIISRNTPTQEGKPTQD